MKAKILAAARRVFGEYGYHGATTRIIAKEVGIDISTLHYHWGDKKDLYEAVSQDVVEDMRLMLRRIERVVHGHSLEERLRISIDMTTDYFFQHPEMSNLYILWMFSNTREPMSYDDELKGSIRDIARAMGLQEPDGTIALPAEMQVLTTMNSIQNFIAGEEFYRSVLNMTHKEYVPLAKETLKSMLIPLFVSDNGVVARVRGSKERKGAPNRV